MEGHLSQCFFQVCFLFTLKNLTYILQKFVDGQVQADMQPMLQVMETRKQMKIPPMGMDNQPLGEQSQLEQLRVRLNDGVYSYSGCVVPLTLCKRFEEDGLCSHNGVIKV